jgi:Mn2+/Fe2+ NRAMP family transporter
LSAAQASPDPYAIHPADAEPPPSGLGATLRRIGPGVVLAASIVGSGELIATTTLGARVGYTALWIILLSCAIKPAVQAELGRYTIATGETGLAGMNHVPGPRLYRVNWIVWLWALMTIASLMQVGAMYGGVTQVMQVVAPAVPREIYLTAFAGLTLSILLGGGYERVERFAVLKVSLFAFLTVLAAVLLVRSPSFRVGEMIAGLRPQIPTTGLGTALAVFGITGVGASELFMYPYWCVEKGYARRSGINDGSAAWQARARGWTRVMMADILTSLVIYTLATVAFYLLGAGILHPAGTVPKGNETITTLSAMYTATLGAWSAPVFYLGAVVTLYGTIFAATAANSRVFSDMTRLMGAFEAHDSARRTRMRDRFIVWLTVVPILMYLLFGNPVQMVVIGGTAQALMLPVIGVGALYLRHRKLPPSVAPGAVATVALWIATLVMSSAALYYTYLYLRGQASL